MTWLPYLAAPAFLTAIGGAIAWLYKARQDAKREPDARLNAAIEQWKAILGGSVDELREQNAYQATLIQKQRDQIEELEAENEKLERLVRTVTQQSMDAAHREKLLADKYDDLMKEYGKLLHRFETEEGGSDAA